MRSALLALVVIGSGCGGTSKSPLSFASTTKHVQCANDSTIPGVTFTYEERFTSDGQAWVGCSVSDGVRGDSWAHSWTTGSTWGGDGWCKLAYDVDSAGGSGTWIVAQNTADGHTWDPAPAIVSADGGTPPAPFFAQYGSSGTARDGYWVVLPCEVDP